MNLRRGFARRSEPSPTRVGTQGKEDGRRNPRSLQRRSPRLAPSLGGAGEVAAPDVGQLLLRFGQARAFNFGPLGEAEARSGC